MGPWVLLRRNHIRLSKLIELLLELRHLSVGRVGRARSKLLVLLLARATASFHGINPLLLRSLTIELLTLGRGRKSSEAHWSGADARALVYLVLGVLILLLLKAGQDAVD